MTSTSLDRVRFVVNGEDVAVRPDHPHLLAALREELDASLTKGEADYGQLAAWYSFFYICLPCQVFRKGEREQDVSRKKGNRGRQTARQTDSWAGGQTDSETECSASNLLLGAY